MNQDIRANIIMVLSRVREPRSMDDICWHVTDTRVGRHEVAHTIDVMALTGEIEIVANDTLPLRYRLAHPIYRIPEPRYGWNPEHVLPRLTVAVIAVGLLMLAVIIWRSMP